MIPNPYHAPRDLGDLELQALLARSSEPVVLASHWAGWDRPWPALSPADWHELAREFGERVNLARVESGANRASAARFGLEIIPVVLVVLGGTVVARFTGHVRPAEVCAAVRAAMDRGRELETAERELAGVRAARERLSPVRSVLRSRADPVAVLAHAS